MRGVGLAIVLLSGCGQTTEIIRSCVPTPMVFGAAGELEMFAYPFRDPWPSGHTVAVAVGPVRFRLSRWETCQQDRVRLVPLTELVRADLTPASLGSIGAAAVQFESIDLDAQFLQAGDGILAVTVRTEDGDEVSDQIALRARAPTDLAVEISSDWASSGDSYAREPQLERAQWQTGHVWRTADDGEVLAAEIDAGTRTSVLELVSYSADSARGVLELAAGTGTLRFVAPNANMVPETVAAIPLEVVARTAITSATMMSGTTCFTSSGGQVDVTLHDGAGRTVRGGGFAVVSSAPTIVHVVGSTYSPDVAPYNCLATGTATLSMDLPNAAANKTITVQ